MKKFIVIFSLLMAFPIFAQPQKGEKRAKMHEKRMAYLKETVTLEPQQAKEFWPVYEEYRREMAKLKPSAHKGKKSGELSPEEMEEHIQEGFRIRAEKLRLQIEYHERFKKIIPIEKVMEVYRAEKTFWKEHRGNNQRKGQNQNHTPGKP